MDLELYSDRMLSQLDWARFFGGPDMVILGDSNGENLAKAKSMRKFGKLGVSCNLAIGGMRADDWSGFLVNGQNGSIVRKKIDDSGAKVVFNVGGNNILQRKMDVVEESLKQLKKIFPESYNCLVPPIHVHGLESAGLDAQVLMANVDRLNGMIRDIWQEKTIDFYSPFINRETGEAYLIVLQDAVHFSPPADEKIRIPSIIAAVKAYG